MLKLHHIDGLSNILNKSTLGGLLGGKRINHLLYADDLCIVSLSSAGLQHLLSICDQYCASHSLTINVRKSVCMFFKSKMNKFCDNVPVVLSGNTIDFVHETKYLGVIINSSMKTSSAVVCQTRKFMHKQICYCAVSVIAPMMQNVRYSSHFVPTCTVALFGLTPLHLPLKS